MNLPIPGTAIAAVCERTVIGDASRRVYFQDNTGGISETKYTPSNSGGGTWSISTKPITTGFTHPKAKSPIGACCGRNLGQIRVYYLSDANILQELSWSVDTGNWSSGSLTALNIQVAPYSNIAVMTSDESIDNLSVKMYVQLLNNTIQEYLFNGRTNVWTAGNPFGPALAGTKIATAVWGNGNNNIYFQDVQNIVTEYWWSSNGWNRGFTIQKPSYCMIAVVLDVEMPNVSRLYLGNADTLYPGTNINTIEEWGFSNSWNLLDTWPAPPALPNSNLAVIHWSGPQIRGYDQDGSSGTSITEWVNINGSWSPGSNLL